MAISAIAAGLLALTLYSAADVLLKGPSAKAGGAQTSLVASASAAALLAALCPFFAAPIGLYSALLSAVTGILMGAGTLLVLTSLETQQVSDTMALVAISYAIPVIFGAAILRERVGPVEWAGIALIFSGSTAVSLKDMKLNKYLMPAALGNVAWGLQFITLKMAIRSVASILPVAALSSAVSVVPVAAYAGLTKGLRAKAPAKAAAAGALLALGLIFALMVLEGSEVALGMSIIAAEPALVTLLGLVMLKERVNWLQALGVIMATAGIVAVVG